MPEDLGLYRDRMTGNRVAAVPVRRTLIGRWLVLFEGDELFINSAAATVGDFLVPETSGQWSVLTSEGHLQSGAIARAQGPDDLDLEAVRTIGGRLEAMIESGAGWLEWINLVPMVSALSDEKGEKVELKPLERLIQELFGHLETVCRKPRTHLRVEIKRVPASRARRVPVSAASYLASHTEDWERPLLRGVVPKRTLAETRQDEIDIYENRVAARLLDNLGAHLNRRIRMLRRLLKVFQDKEDYSSELSPGTYQLRDRMSRLWGESIDANRGRENAKSVLGELETLKHRLMGLRDSPLYVEVPRKAHVPVMLKTTNVLTNDGDYRRVAELWREWAGTGAGRYKSPAELHDEAQRACRGLDAFALLLVLRALESLGYEPPAESLEMPIRRCATLSITGHALNLEIDWNDDGTMTLRAGERQLTIVALATNLVGGGDDHVQESLGGLRDAAYKRADRDLLVVFLRSDAAGEAPGEALASSLHTIGNDPRHMLAGCACLPVSPWELGSTERVARALRWFLSGTRFLGYPWRVPIPSRARGQFDFGKHSRWITVEADGSVELRAPPLEHEWARLGVPGVAKRLQEELERTELEHQQLTNDAKDDARRNWGGELQRRKREMALKVDALKEAFGEASRLTEQLEHARASIDSLLECPACGQVADPMRRFQARDRDTFHCQCEGCNTTWGVRLCQSGHRYPMMLPSDKFKDTDELEPGWEDRVYGCDLLAVPAQTPGGQWGFICPECGRVD